jgi:atypical dual specificity phosphatase
LNKQKEMHQSSFEDIHDITQIDENVYASGLPKTNDWKGLQKLGIMYVVNLMMEPHNEKFVNEHGIQVVHVPVKNFTSPSLDQIKFVLDFLEEHKNDKILVHCWAGLGRTGTVLACHLIKTRGMTPLESIEYVRKLRPGSVETKDQEATILNFH